MAKDLKIVQDTQPVSTRDEFEKQFDYAKNAIRLHVNDWGYKFHFNQLTKLAFKLAPKAEKNRDEIKKSLKSQHTQLVGKYRYNDALEKEHPGGRYLYAYDGCCDRLRQLVCRNAGF